MVGCARGSTWANIRALQEGSAMSAVEFGLTPRTPFLSTPTVAPFEQDFAEPVADFRWNQPDDFEWMATLSMNGCVLPLVSRDRVLGLLALGKRGPAPYTPDELDSLRQVSSQVTVVVENFLLHSELKKLRDQSI